MATEILESAPVPHGQWSKWLFCGQTWWSNLRFTILTIGHLDFGRGHGRNFDHLTMVFFNFGHGHGQNGKFCG